MLKDNVTRTLRILRKFGFQIQIDASEFGEGVHRELRAVQAAASLLYGVAEDAFDLGGNWSSVKACVLANGLKKIDNELRREYSFGQIEASAINEALVLALELLELS